MRKEVIYFGRYLRYLNLNPDAPWAEMLSEGYTAAPVGWRGTRVWAGNRSAGLRSLPRARRWKTVAV